MLFREDASTDEFIDMIMGKSGSETIALICAVDRRWLVRFLFFFYGFSGNRKYIKCIYLYNKIDTITIEEVDEIARRPRHVVCSVHKK